MAKGSKGSTRGVEHPIAEDAALVGDTRHELHTKPLPRNESPFKAHQNPYNPGAGEDPQMFRCDDGMGGEC